jgi:L-threonylcarbamoyladenylate synthase
MRLVDPEQLREEVDGLPGAVVVLARGAKSSEDPQKTWFEMPHEASDYGRVLYDSLRRADRVGAKLIVVERPPASHDWTAIHDRLARAEGS